AFGNVTFELEVPYEYDTAPGETAYGFNNINFGARSPLYQFVSSNELGDSSVGVGIQACIPTDCVFGTNAELVPKILNDIKIGNFTAQCVLGHSTLFGPGPDGGSQTFEYGFMFGYTIPRHQLQLPAVQQLVPFFELSGETGLNNGNSGHNSLLGDAGF